VNRDRELARVLVAFARTLGTDFSIAQTLEHLVQQIVEALPVTGAGVMLLDSAGELHSMAASDETSEWIEALQNELQEGPCLAAYFSGVPIAICDVAADDRFPRYSSKAAEKGVGAVFSFPLKIDGQLLGALDLIRDAPGDLDEADRAAAATLTDVAAAYLFNAKLRSDARDSEQLLRHRSLHDPLTGLPNRTLLEERLEHAVARARGSDRMAAVLFADLDGFKAVNDRFGHHSGDQLLKVVASRLNGVLRPGDTLARLSGDEFVVLCEDLADQAQAEAVARRISRVLAKPFVIDGHALTVTASVGVAFSGLGSDIPKELLKDADQAMYAAKRGGGAQHHVVNRVVGRALDESLPRWDHILGGSGRGLERALERDELSLVYQPIVDTRDGSLSAVEALLRWEHPAQGWVAAETIVGIAERTGLIVPIGKWALLRACEELQGWRRAHATDAVPDLTVNVSAHQVMGEGFPDTVSQVLRATGTDPANLYLEVTESVFLIDEPRAHAVLSELKGLGVGLALDDFGTGYSSLAYLKKFPFDIVKIDRSFVSDVGSDPSTRAIVGAIIGLSHALELLVVAEGVETPDQLDHIRGLGAERAQGHYFSQPMPANDLAAQILANAGTARARLPLQRSDRS
jgi:diguanylate cyclase (GGDEF)-like protein